MKINKYFLIIIMMIFICSFVYADYSNIGNDGTFISDSGIFTSSLVPTITGLKTYSDTRLVPLVNDLDSDGTNEIIVFADDTLFIYQNKELTFIDSISQNCTGEIYSMFIHDIDGDGNNSIILADSSLEKLCIIDFYNDSLIMKKVFDLSTLTHTNGEMLVLCGGDSCLLSYHKEISSTPSTNGVYAVGFNMTYMSSEINIVAGEVLTQVYCFPKIRAGTVIDYDGDLTDEYIFNIAQVIRLDDIILKTLYVSLNQTLHPAIERTVSISTGITPDSNPSCIEDIYGKYFTPPLVYDLADNPHLETVTGYMIDADEFKMRMYSSTGSLIDTFPEIFLADGVIISDVMLFDAFSDSGKDDFCVLGYEHNDGVADLLCGSKRRTGLLSLESDEFFIDMADNTLWNVSITYKDYDIISHASEQVTGNGIDELSCSYGILELQDSGDDLILINRNPQGDGAVIMADVENIGLSDMLIYTDSNLFYYDDGFANSPAEIDGYIINPCLNSVWKINTTYGFSITVLDSDGDSVQARAIIYNGTANEYTHPWTSLSGSGATFFFSGTINQTISDGIITLQGRDSENIDDIDSIDLRFTVSTNGVVYGDCTTIVSGLVDAVEVNESITGNFTENEPNNAVISTANAVGGMLGLGTFLGYIILLVGISILIFIFNREERYGSDKEALIIIGGFDIIGIIIGTYLKIIPSGFIWTLFVIGILYIGTVLSSKFFGSKNNNG